MINTVVNSTNKLFPALTWISAVLFCVAITKTFHMIVAVRELALGSDSGHSPDC